MTVFRPYLPLLSLQRYCGIIMKTFAVCNNSKICNIELILRKYALLTRLDSMDFLRAFNHIGHRWRATQDSVTCLLRDKSPYIYGFNFHLTGGEKW